MNLVFHYAALGDLIAPYYPARVVAPFALGAVLRIHCIQPWFTLSDLATEEALFDTPIEAQPSAGETRTGRAGAQGILN